MGFDDFGNYGEILLHRNVAGTMAWNRLHLGVWYDYVGSSRFVLVIESSANQTGFVSAVSKIRLSMEACPALPTFSGGLFLNVKPNKF